MQNAKSVLETTILTSTDALSAIRQIKHAVTQISNAPIAESHTKPMTNHAKS